MDSMIINSLKSVQGVIINDRHCFECYGYVAAAAAAAAAPLSLFPTTH